MAACDNGSRRRYCGRVSEQIGLVTVCVKNLYASVRYVLSDCTYSLPVDAASAWKLRNLEPLPPCVLYDVARPGRCIPERSDYALMPQLAQRSGKCYDHVLGAVKSFAADELQYGHRLPFLRRVPGNTSFAATIGRNACHFKIESK
jgi:hypothetical protein